MNPLSPEAVAARAVADARIEALRAELLRKREKVEKFRAMVARREEKLRKRGIVPPGS